MFKNLKLLIVVLSDARNGGSQLSMTLSCVAFLYFHPKWINHMINNLVLAFHSTSGRPNNFIKLFRTLSSLTDFLSRLMPLAICVSTSLISNNTGSSSMVLFFVILNNFMANAVCLATASCFLMDSLLVRNNFIWSFGRVNKPFFCFRINCHSSEAWKFFSHSLTYVAKSSKCLCLPAFHNTSLSSFNIIVLCVVLPFWEYLYSNEVCAGPSVMSSDNKSITMAWYENSWCNGVDKSSARSKTNNWARFGMALSDSFTSVWWYHHVSSSSSGFWQLSLKCWNIFWQNLSTTGFDLGLWFKYRTIGNSCNDTHTPNNLLAMSSYNWLVCRSMTPLEDLSCPYNVLRLLPNAKLM